MLAAFLLASTPARAQSVGPVRLSADVLMDQVDVDTGVGAAVSAQVRTPGAWGVHLAVRPETTATSEGGTGSTYGTDAVQPDGVSPDYTRGAGPSAATGDEVEGWRCGSTALDAAVGAEVGARVAVGSGAALAGVGLRAGHGRGVYGALTGRLAAPLYARVEAGTGHWAASLGFGGSESATAVARLADRHRPVRASRSRFQRACGAGESSPPLARPRRDLDRYPRPPARR